MEVVGSCASNPTCDGMDQPVVRHVLPALKVVAMHPDDVGIALVAIAEEPAVFPCLDVAVRAPARPLVSARTRQGRTES